MGSNGYSYTFESCGRAVGNYPYRARSRGGECWMSVSLPPPILQRRTFSEPQGRGAKPSVCDAAVLRWQAFTGKRLYWMVMAVVMLRSPRPAPRPMTTGPLRKCRLLAWPTRLWADRKGSWFRRDDGGLGNPRGQDRQGVDDRLQDPAQAFRHRARCWPCQARVLAGAEPAAHRTGT